MTNLKKWTAVAMVMIALFTSCKTNDAPQEYINTYTQTYTVYQKNWNIGIDDNNDKYYYYEFQEPNLSRYIYENGSMQAFLYVSGENISPLPFNDYLIDKTNTDIKWTEQVTCEFRPGYVTFIVKSSDHLQIPPYYDEYDFMVRFMW